MTIKTSSFGGGGYPKLGVDLTAPATWEGFRPSIGVTGINPSAGLTTALSITGEKGVITYLAFALMTSENYTIKLTVDGEVKFNDVWAVAIAAPVFCGGYGATNPMNDPIPYDNSFLLEIQSTTDTSIDMTYFKRVLA